MRYSLYLLLLFSSCTYNELIVGCTDATDPSFSECVKPIIENNCVSCHSYGGDAGFLLLTDYDLIKLACEQNNLLNSIKTTMPKSGLMPAENINIIEKWFLNGAPNN